MLGLWLSIFVTFTFSNAITVVTLTLLFVTVTTILVAVGADIIFDITKHHNCTGTFTDRDVLNYRVDSIILFTVCCANLIYIILYLISQSILSTEGLHAKYVGVYAPMLFLDNYARWMLIMGCGGSCIVVVIYRMILGVLKRRSGTLSKHELFQKTITSSSGSKALEKYCEAEFSVENFRAYEDIQLYKSLKDPVEKLSLARNMYALYVQDGYSLLQVNLSQKCRKTLEDYMQQAANGANVLDVMFADFEFEVTANLQDTFNRFALSRTFGKLKV
jgi:hypothetical protein